VHLSAGAVSSAPRASVVVCRRQLAHVEVALTNDVALATTAVTTRISVRLTEQAKAKHESHRGSPGHCSSNRLTVPASSMNEL